MHARASLYVVKGQGDLCSRHPVSTVPPQWADIPARASNNFYILPAIGMVVFATQASRVTNKMFIEAARAVADQVPSELLNQGLLYPLPANILETEIQTAARVAKLVFDFFSGLRLFRVGANTGFTTVPTGAVSAALVQIPIVEIHFRL